MKRATRAAIAAAELAGLSVALGAAVANGIGFATQVWVERAIRNFEQKGRS